MEGTLPEDFWTRLDRLIQEKRLSRSKLSSLVNELEELEGRSTGKLNERTIATWKNRRGFPELNRVKSIAAVLKTTVGTLLFGTAEPAIDKDFESVKYGGDYDEFCLMRARQLRDFQYLKGHWEPLTPAVSIAGRNYRDPRRSRYLTALRGLGNSLDDTRTDTSGLRPIPGTDELAQWCIENSSWLEKLYRLPLTHQLELISLIEFKLDNVDEYK